jgi:DeoR/GlpR family transcriptional regulator of sugar metabolism
MSEHVPGLVAALDMLEAAQKAASPDLATVVIPSGAMDAEFISLFAKAAPSLLKMFKAQVAFRQASTIDARGWYLAAMDEAMDELPIAVLGPLPPEVLNVPV